MPRIVYNTASWAMPRPVCGWYCSPSRQWVNGAFASANVNKVGYSPFEPADSPGKRYLTVVTAYANSETTSLKSGAPYPAGSATDSCSIERNIDPITGAESFGAVSGNYSHTSVTSTGTETTTGTLAVDAGGNLIWNVVNPDGSTRVADASTLDSVTGARISDTEQETDVTYVGDSLWNHTGGSTLTKTLTDEDTSDAVLGRASTLLATCNVATMPMGVSPNFMIAVCAFYKVYPADISAKVAGCAASKSASFSAKTAGETALATAISDLSAAVADAVTKKAAFLLAKATYKTLQDAYAAASRAVITWTWRATADHSLNSRKATAISDKATALAAQTTGYTPYSAAEVANYNADSLVGSRKQAVLNARNALLVLNDQYAADDYYNTLIIAADAAGIGSPVRWGVGLPTSISASRYSSEGNGTEFTWVSLNSCRYSLSAESPQDVKADTPPIKFKWGEIGSPPTTIDVPYPEVVPDFKDETVLPTVLSGPSQLRIFSTAEYTMDAPESDGTLTLAGPLAGPDVFPQDSEPVFKRAEKLGILNYSQASTDIPKFYLTETVSGSFAGIPATATSPAIPARTYSGARGFHLVEDERMRQSIYESYSTFNVDATSALAAETDPLFPWKIASRTSKSCVLRKIGDVADTITLTLSDEVTTAQMQTNEWIATQQQSEDTMDPASTWSVNVLPADETMFMQRKATFTLIVTPLNALATWYAEDHSLTVSWKKWVRNLLTGEISVSDISASGTMNGGWSEDFASTERETSLPDMNTLVWFTDFKVTDSDPSFFAAQFKAAFVTS